MCVIFPSVASYAFSKGACYSVFSEVQLHPNATSKSKVISTHRDAFGSYYQLNVSVVRPDAAVIYEALGYASFESQARLPHPDTMTSRIRELFPEVDIKFVAVNDSTIPAREYLEYLAKGEVPIGMKGQFYHDMMDHAVGYFLLARTPEWKLLRQKIAELLAEEIKNTDTSAGASFVLKKINNYLEAVTPAFVLEFELGPQSYSQFVKDNAVKIRRLIDAP
mgnify:CR=1 FL=1